MLVIEIFGGFFRGVNWVLGRERERERGWVVCVRKLCQRETKF
jgi:hypothetical protein